MNVIHMLTSMRIVDGQPYIRGDTYVADLRALAAACRELSGCPPPSPRPATQPGSQQPAPPGRRLDLDVARVLERCADQADAELIGRLSTAARTRPAPPRTSRTTATHPPSWIRPALWLLAASITGVALAEIHEHGLGPTPVFHLVWLSTVIGLATRPGWGTPQWKHRAGHTSGTPTGHTRQTGTRTQA